MTDRTPIPDINVHKIYVREDDMAVIVCKSCGTVKTMNAAPFLHKQQVRIRCRCGVIFNASFEKRKQYRKEVSLAGTYSRVDPSRDAGEMMVEDLSVSGLGFRTHYRSKLQIGDIVKVQFTLDDIHKSVIIRMVAVRRVIDRFVGAEFCGADSCPPLSFYLRP